MRVLLVTPYPVWPPFHGGRVRVAGLARGLAAAGPEVVLLAPWHPRQPPADLCGPRVEHRTQLRFVNALPALTRGRLAPAQALVSLQPSRSAIRRLLRGLGRFDVYQFEFCANATWIDLVPPGSTIVYSAHNVERDFHADESGRYLLRRGPGRRIERLERTAVERADLVVACSDSDAARLTELYGPHRSVVVPNGAQPGAGAVALGAGRDRLRGDLGLRPEHRVILFVGGDAFHNVEGVDFLTDHVMPFLGQHARLVLAGASSRRTQGGVGDPRVIRLGPVRELGPLLAAADVGVNPVAFGSGTSVKVADYLAARLPVVATPEGVRGLDHTDGIRVVPREQLAAALAEVPLEVDGRPAGRLDGQWSRLVEPLAARITDLHGSQAARSRSR